jgi:hypothetical protein
LGDRKGRLEVWVGAREGEVFEIHMANKSKIDVAMHLLVDGLNTLGQERTRLGRGRAWVLEANKEYAVPGWVLPPKEPGGDNVIRRFQFVEMSKSVAGRQNFGDSIGLITAAFYAERVAIRPQYGPGGDQGPNRRDPPRLSGDLQQYGPGVGDEGPEEGRRLQTTNFEAGRLLGVVHIRYVDEADLKK